MARDDEGFNSPLPRVARGKLEEVHTGFISIVSLACSPELALETTVGLEVGEGHALSSFVLPGTDSPPICANGNVEEDHCGHGSFASLPIPT